MTVDRIIGVEWEGDEMTGQLTPERIMTLGVGFWGSKTLLSAVELGVFSELGTGALDGETLRKRLGLHTRSARDFFDALVALGMLERHDGQYANTPETGQFLDRAKPSYIGGILEMLNTRLYPFWASLTDGLRTGEPQNEAKTGVTSSLRSTLIRHSSGSSSMR
jgi:Dimerisation domain